MENGAAPSPPPLYWWPITVCLSAARRVPRAPQNAKKIADRKAKKPPADPPKPPEAPEAHPEVEKLKNDLEAAMAEAEAKIFEARSGKALVVAMDETKLTADVLNDLGERPCGDDHPNVAELATAVATAETAKCEADLQGQGKDVLDKARKTRLAARTMLAKGRLLEASSPAPEVCDVKVRAPHARRPPPPPRPPPPSPPSAPRARPPPPSSSLPLRLAHVPLPCQPTARPFPLPSPPLVLQPTTSRPVPSLPR